MVCNGPLKVTITPFLYGISLRKSASFSGKCYSFSSYGYTSLYVMLLLLEFPCFSPRLSSWFLGLGFRVMTGIY